MAALTGRAESALGPVQRRDPLLNRVDPISAGAPDALHRGHVVAVEGEQRREAGVGGEVADGCGVGVEVREHHRAGPAAALAAPQLRAREARAAQVLRVGVGRIDELLA